jgi:hypothetical protein
MITVRNWLFNCILAVYAIYNLLWVVGTMFSFGRNDTYGEIFFTMVTFVVDIPIMWYMTRRLKRGLLLLAVAMSISIALGSPFHVLYSLVVPAMWYGPKIIMVLMAIWAYRSKSQTGKPIAATQ